MTSNEPGIRFWLETVLLNTADLAPLALIGAIALVLSAAISLMLPRRRKRRRPFFPHRGATLQERHDLRDPLAQLRTIAECDFEKVPMLNNEEARLLPILEHIVSDIGGGHRLMAQISLGELIRPSKAETSPSLRQRGHAAINAKRLDFAVIDPCGYLAVAIEYQGSGHYHSDSFMRDAVKREALRKAGVPTLEIRVKFTREDVRANLIALLEPDRASARTGT